MTALPSCDTITKPSLKIWKPPHSGAADCPTEATARANAGSQDATPTASVPSNLFTAEQVAALLQVMTPGTLVRSPEASPSVADQMTVNHLVVKTGSGATPPPLSGRSISEVIQPYFNWATSERAANTLSRIRLSWSQYAESLGSSEWSAVCVSSAYAFAASHDWAANTRAGRLTDLTTVCNWLLRARLISANPLAGLSKPARESRKKYVTWELHRRILGIVSDPTFKALVILAWETGGRPQELRPLEARHVQFEQQRIFIPAVEAKGKRPRKIYLSERATRLLRVLCRRHPTGPLFPDRCGRLMTSNALSHRFAKLREKLGDAGIGLVCTCYRHGFATRLLEASESNSTVAELMGHTTTVMVDRVYSHLCESDTHLLAALRRS